MRQVNFRLPDEMLERVEKARGAVPRNRWLRLAVEQALALPESGRLVSATAEEPDDAAVSDGDTRFESRTSAPAEQPRALMRRSPRYAPRRDVKPFMKP